MSIVTRSRQIFSIVLKSNKNPRLYSSFTANTPKEPISSASILNDQSSLHPPPPPPPESAPADKVGRKPLSFLMYTVIAALTGGVATAGLVTYGMCFPIHLWISEVAIFFLRNLK